MTTANVLQSTAVQQSANESFECQGIVALPAPCACKLHARLLGNAQLDWATPHVRLQLQSKAKRYKEKCDMLPSQMSQGSHLRDSQRSQPPTQPLSQPPKRHGRNFEKNPRRNGEATAVLDGCSSSPRQALAEVVLHLVLDAPHRNSL